MHPGVAAEAGAPDSCGGCDTGLVSTAMLEVATATADMSSHLWLASLARSLAWTGLFARIFSISLITAAVILGTSCKQHLSF